MRRETQRRVVSTLARISLLWLTLLVCGQPVLAFSESSNIVCREELPIADREVLTEKLRGIIGLPVAFNENGALRVISPVANGGSRTARDLVLKALSGPNIIAIEPANNRDDVVFSRVVTARWKHHSSALPPAFVVLIDFDDFDHLMGDEAALKAFDVGWAFLHELDHVVNDSSDAVRANDEGECEDHINLMRQECNLPVRAEYFFTYFPTAAHSTFRTRLVRLAFNGTDAATKKHRRYWVIWDATLVGGLPTSLAAAH